MGGERYYTFKKNNVALFALDSTYMNPAQLDWLDAPTAEIERSLENLLLPSPSVLGWKVSRTGPGSALGAGSRVSKIQS